MNIISPRINANIPHNKYFPVVIDSKNNEIARGDGLFMKSNYLLKDAIGFCNT